MTFDATVNLGQILTLIVTAVGGAGVIIAMRADLRALVNRVSSVEEAIKTQTGILVTLGRQEIRLDSHERRLDRLEDAA